MKFLHSAELLVGFVVAMLLVNYFTATNENFEEFALGKGTSVHFAVDGIAPIHFDKFESEILNEFEKGWLARGQKDVILILGNSQTHGINQFKEGQRPYNHLLFEALKDSFDVLTVSIPNVSFQDMLLAVDYFIVNYPVIKIVVPAFMDDMREDGLKQHIWQNLATTGFRMDDTLNISRLLNENLDEIAEVAESQDSHENGLAAVNQTDQERSEYFLNERMNDWSSSWKNRPTLRGKIFTKLYQARNSIFNISPETKRKSIPARYEKNMKSLIRMIQISDERGVNVLLYIPPIRSDVEIPYVAEEYSVFKTDVAKLVQIGKQSKVEFYNFEDIVPGQYWGVKSATNLSGKEELDFMHFQYEGHVRLYNELIQVIK